MYVKFEFNVGYKKTNKNKDICQSIFQIIDSKWKDKTTDFTMMCVDFMCV